MQFNLRKEENKNIDSIFICVCKQLIKAICLIRVFGMHFSRLYTLLIVLIFENMNILN